MRLETLMALGDLPSREREALWDNVVLDTPTEVIAANLQCSPQWVNHLIRSGKAKLLVSLRKEA
jgi:DNA-directed RNA polymerase specialized sigma24 family protein